MKYYLLLVIVFFLSLNLLAQPKEDKKHMHNEEKSKDHEHSNEEHTDHEEESEEESEEDEDHHDHDDEHKDEHGSHEEEESENSVVGVDKGILEKGENGFKLSSEALKSFGIKTSKIHSKIFEMSKSALVETKDKKFVYRIRDGWIKSVSAKIIKKSGNNITVDIENYKNGDDLIITGVGFIRTSELVVEEGVSHGHSH